MYELQMKYMNDERFFWVLQLFFFQPCFHQIAFQIHGTYVLIAHLEQVLISLTWQLYSWLNDVRLSIDMFWTPRLRIYTFILVGTFGGILQCKWMNHVIRTYHFSLSFWFLMPWKQTSLSEFFEALFHFFHFWPFLFYW